MSSAAPAVTVVIPTRNRPDALRDCLAALLASTLADFEVRVMDQSEGEASREAVERFRDARLVYTRMPRPGACPARNLGAASARAAIVAFLDDDCAPPVDWLANIAAHFAADPELQFVLGDMVAAPCDPALGVVPECLPSRRLTAASGIRAVMHHCSGGNMSVRKGLLRRIGAFDEMLGPANPWVRCNDVSLPYKVVRSGARWMAAGDVAVLHLHGFRSHEAMADVHCSAIFGAGVHWGRALRRRQWDALRHGSAAEVELLRRPIGHLLRLQKPRGTRPALMHLRGVLAGLRLPGHVGLVDGAELRRIEATGRVDAEPGAGAAGANLSMPGAVTRWS